MALYSQATDLITRRTVWISTNVSKGKPQLNSHRDDRLGASMRIEGIDGFSAAEISNLSHDDSKIYRCPVSGWTSLLSR